MSDHTEYGAREQGRNAALAGREIFVNPHMGGDAEAWFAGYREVPEELRGSQPDLKTRGKTIRKPKRVPMSKLHVRALGDRTLPGSTPLSPFGEAIAAEVAATTARTPKPWAIDGGGW